MSESHKYARGVSARPASHQTPLTILETVTLVHVGALVILGAWAFGGNADWSRTLLSWLASLGGLITLTALQSAGARKEGGLRPLRWLWPLAAVNALVFASAFNPSFREVIDGTKVFYVQGAANPHFPSSARPLLSFAQLWFFDGVYLSCFNLALIVRQRRALRGLLLVLSANAVALAVFGTLQKLVGATGLYFGLQKSPQIFYFSTFIYHNHWGAFIVLMTAASLGLIFHFARRNDARDFWHSPAAGGLMGIVLLAASVPLSGSRSTSLLMVILLSLGFLHWISRLIKRRRAYKESVALPLLLSVVGLAAAGAFAYDIGRPMIEHRLAATETQVAQIRTRGSLGQRATLYRDTWRMAQEKPWFGWGMASYPTVFYTFNTQQISKVDGLPTYYNDAHSDWLQSLAEHGCVGTALFALCGLVPLWHRRRALFQSPLTIYLLAGCGLLLLYAWVEFPFGNGSVITAFWTCFFCAVHYGRLDSSADNPTAPA
jgi:O-antigen ligase